MLAKRFIRSITTHSKTQSAIQSAAATNSMKSEIHTVNSLPGPPRLPGYGSLWMLDKMIFPHKRRKIYLHQIDLVKKYGKLVNLSFGKENMIGVACPKIMEEVLRTQDQGIPFRPVAQPWTDYVDESGVKPGLITSQHEEWKKRRFSVSPLLLKANSFDSYIPSIQSIISEFTDTLQSRSDESGYIQNLPLKLTHLAHEVMTQVLFGVRLNCSTGNPNEKAKRFVLSVAQIVEDSFNYKAVYSSILRKFNTRGWQEHKEAWETCIAEATGLTAHSLANREKFEHEGYLPLVFGIVERMDKDEVMTMITELLMGGVDTTSNTMGFAICLLAKHPESQERLREEIQNLGDRRAESKYVKNIVKETLRLFPIAPINGRKIKKEFISETSGVLFSEDMTVLLFNYFMNRNPEIFEHADKFIPERFDRENTTPESPERGFVSIPFGFGVRSCIGRRLAELELHLTIIDIVSKYRIELIENVKFDPVLRGVLTPGLELPVKFIKI